MPQPTFKEAFRFWLKLGFISFGGPTGQIAIMHTELVEKKKWIDETRFLHALNYCMLLPGPEAQQLAIYIGWLLHKTAGGLVAGILFVLPSIFILWALSLVYVTYGKLESVGAIFYGLQPAVLAIVAFAVIRLGKKALRGALMAILAGVAFVAIYVFKLPFPLIVFCAGALGFIINQHAPHLFPQTTAHGKEVVDHAAHVATEPTHASLKPSLKRALKIAALALSLWWLPILAAGMWFGWSSTLFQQGLFFSQAAMVTFGGAYAVLPYVAQRAVENYHWLNAAQMLDGLALAETTPGPLIMVLQFVGFLGGWNQPGALTPLVAATLSALLTTWATFAPCFLWIFLGAPHIESLRGNKDLSATLSAITAAVVGVVLNLAIWFGAHVLFPSPAAFDYFSAALSVITFVGLLKWNWNLIAVVIASGALGWLFKSFPF